MPWREENKKPPYLLGTEAYIRGSTLLAFPRMASHRLLARAGRPGLLYIKMLSARGLTEAQADSAALPLSAYGGNSLFGVFSVSFRSQTVFYNIIYAFFHFVKSFLQKNKK